MKIIQLKTVDSTNTFAANLKNQQKLPYIVQSDYQNQGRGQGQNSWISEEGKNLLFSIIFDSKFVPVDKNFFISKFIAVCLHELLQKYNKDAVIKWPNDILIGTKMIAGILIENTIFGNQFSKSIAGIGLNVNQIFVDESLTATSLRELSGNKYDISGLLGEFVEIFEKNTAFLKEENFDTLNRKYFDSLFKYREIHSFLKNGVQFNAKILDVQDDGLIVLEHESGNLERFSFGEIDFLIK